MNFEPDPAIAAFRAEVRDFLRERLPAEMARRTLRGYHALKSDMVAWTRILHARGWSAPHWPVEHGGPGWSPLQRHVFEEECALAGAPPTCTSAFSLVAPVIYSFGSEAQKRRHLPPILRGDTFWGQGFSEPNAGSDLASLRTRAERDGDHYVVNGQKTWTTEGHYADWLFVLVRTDLEAKPQRGISFLLIDMTSPGVTTRPIKLISGKSPFCETFFDRVRVPRHQLVGELNGGWTIAKYLLTHEREMIGAIGERSTPKPVGRHAVERLGRDESGRLSDGVLRAEIARFEVDEAAFRAWMRMAGEQARAGEAHGALSSALKYYGAELNKRRWELMMAVGGADALEWEGERSQEGTAARTWLRTKANSIEGGTSEVQLNVVSKRILGLPG